MNTKAVFATYSLMDDTGNSSHHLGPSLDDKALVGGGLLSLLKTQPKFKQSNRALLSFITDEIRVKPDGGFFITYLGSAVGTLPDHLIEADADFNIIHEWPEDIEGTLIILGEQCSPHSPSIDFEKNIILISDFDVPVIILKPASAADIQKANTLRLWELPSRKITSTITISDAQGIQDVHFIPGNSESAAIATAGVAELLYDLGSRARENMAMYPDLADDGNHVAAPDISDLNNVKRFDNPDKDQGIVSPYYIKVSPDKKNLLVTDYSIQTHDIGIVDTPADVKAQ
ncbi:hypothetical protein P153DRAFT_398845 [Dothidotthia symphoricarpi CBS 119687]|uniref:Uncharacterized protein n=1 Tax=Dothidotthia symphoricarpi CBS 119687 TaxID=1392245 RepID=A0A6A6A4K8_9PLEO|nr:uncharacterized protein P153DRAFT_398845 [Dothidotthia symphoricarpi CBS 119687]KAF2126740.1 hypothetical protein P153DRAFT_398845 [Dothidotthia symphoricarpi CBS 119687]